jgi:hypothetical protein
MLTQRAEIIGEFAYSEIIVDQGSNGGIVPMGDTPI